MKKTITICIFALILSSCYHRIGDLNMISNRNISKNDKCVLLKRYVEAKAKSKNNDALERAIDKAVKSVQGGEYLKNITIKVKNDGRKIKIIGDVWGIK